MLFRSSNCKPDGTAPLTAKTSKTQNTANDSQPTQNVINIIHTHTHTRRTSPERFHFNKACRKHETSAMTHSMRIANHLLKCFINILRAGFACAVFTFVVVIKYDNTSILLIASCSYLFCFTIARHKLPTKVQAYLIVIFRWIGTSAQ